MAKDYGHHSLNTICLSGTIVDVGMSEVRGALAMRARLKMSCYGKSVYVDVIGQKNIAEIMSVTCDIGNQVYVEGRISNAIAQRKTKSTEIAPYIQVLYIECLSRRKSIAQLPEPSVIELLDLCDPIGYLGEVTPKAKKRGKENG